MIVTTLGISLSFTKARNIEQYGASKIGTSFLYILIAAVGLHMDVLAIAETPLVFTCGWLFMDVNSCLLQC